VRIGPTLQSTRSSTWKPPFAIIKPDAVEAKNAGKILARMEAEGFRVVAMKSHRITKAEAEGFYAEHAGKGFFGSSSRT
jgi:nucleoside diphosphate kinase (EC 2.7.4.6)